MREETNNNETYSESKDENKGKKARKEDIEKREEKGSRKERSIYICIYIHIEGETRNINMKSCIYFWKQCKRDRKMREENERKKKGCDKVRYEKM